MSKETKDKTSRRKFLALSFLGGAGLVAGKVEAQTPAESGEKVQMLTPDGKLVEVDRSVLEKSTQRQTAKNEDILNWTKAGK